MAKRISVVVSQGQSAHPAKRRLEEDLVTALMLEPGIEVTVIPHLYDLRADGTGMLALTGISGDMVVLAWMFERAARWTLDRHGVRGQVGGTLLVDQSEDDADDEQDPLPDDQEDRSGSGAGPEPDGKARVADDRFLPSRRIYCLDLRVAPSAEPFVQEIRRIAAECRMQLVSLGDWVRGSPSVEQLARFHEPTNDTALPLSPPSPSAAAAAPPDAGTVPHVPVRVQEDPERRWYPVIDFSRCTNCMECIDFCLFGVYGVDQSETIVVEQPDNCRKGCPACSRVCPENAIMFPQHKTPGIAGAPFGLVSLKIDLSRLFGAPEEGKSASELAALERDEQLVMAGREPVGMAMPKRQPTRSETAPAPKDEFDSLLDELDQANL